MLNARPRITVVVVTATLATFAGASHANLLGNRGFEDPSGILPWGLTTEPSDAAQVFSAAFASSEGNAGLWLRSFVGNQGGSGGPLAQATLTQSITAPADGDYLLTLDWAREAQFTAAAWDVSLASDGFGGPTVSVDLLNASGNLGNFNVLRNTFGGPNVIALRLDGVTAGDALSVTMRMEDGQDALQNPQSAFVDNFVLVAIPEPTSLALTWSWATVLWGRRRR